MVKKRENVGLMDGKALWKEELQWWNAKRYLKIIPLLRYLFPKDEGPAMILCRLIPNLAP